MTETKIFPPEFIKEISMEAFEIVIRRLKGGPEPHGSGTALTGLEAPQLGAELNELAEAADAAFLLWQLAGEDTTVARQTICENLPILIKLVHEEDGDCFVPRNPAPALPSGTDDKK